MDHLPFTPRGLSRELAAFYVGITTAKFDEMVSNGRMPPPISIDNVMLWDRFALDAAFNSFGRGEPEGQPLKAPVPFAAYSPRLLAERWKCSERHIRKMVEQGDLPALRLGGRLLRIKREDVDAYEAGRLNGPEETNFQS